MKSSIYSTIFQNILLEDIVAGDGGAFGAAEEPIYSPPDDIISRDALARRDSRNIYGNAKVKIQRRNNIPLLTGKNKKKRKKRS